MEINLNTDLFGINLRNPIILGSGPLSYSGEGIIRAFRAGAGAVVTKTIRDFAAVNPYPHIFLSGKDTMINAEKWSDISPIDWVTQEIPKAKEAGVVVIGSIGHTPEEVNRWVERVDRAGADIIELVSYQEETMLPMIKEARKLTDKPLIAKLSPNWKNPVKTGLEVLKNGADGITAMDSVGPVLRIDIETRKPLLGSEYGYGWLTGSAIKPIVLRYVFELASKTDKPVIGLGGVVSAEDAVEMLMAGASAVGVCTAPILKGVNYLSKLVREIERVFVRLGINSLSDVIGAALPNITNREKVRKFAFVFDEKICTVCMECVRVCPYHARSLKVRNKNKVMKTNENICRYCGLCASVCPTGALSVTDGRGI